MKKEATKYLLEIFIITVLITFSIPTWKDINASVVKVDSQLASLEQRIEIYSLNSEDPSIVESDSGFKSNKVAVYNSSSIKRSGNLLLLYSKLSTLDYNYLKIDVNGSLYDLSSLLLTTNKDFYVFKLEDITLAKYESREYLINFDLKEHVQINDILGKYFDSNVEITEY